MPDVRSFNPSPTVNQYLRRDASPISSGACVLSALVYPTATPTGTHTILCLGQEAADRGFRIGLNVTVGWFAQTRGATATPFASTAFGGTLNQWYHVLGIFYSDTSRTIIVDDGTPVTNTTSQAATSLDRIAVAALYSAGGFSNVWEGRVCNCGLWAGQVDHSTWDGKNFVSRLANRLSPLIVRRDLLNANYKLESGDNDVDTFGSSHLTAINSPTYVASTPNVIYGGPFLFQNSRALHGRTQVLTGGVT